MTTHWWAVMYISCKSMRRSKWPCKLYHSTCNTKSQTLKRYIIYEQYDTAWFKVCSYYTAIALRYRYIDYFLPQVIAAPPNFELKLTSRYRNVVTSQFLCSRVQLGNATQWRCIMYMLQLFTYLYGLSPVCILRCFRKSLNVVKYLVHPSVSQLKVSPEWMRWWAFNLVKW